MSNHKNKKDLAVLDLSDQDLGTLYFLLSDEITSIRDFCSTPGKSSDELIEAAHNLQIFLPIQQKLERFFKENRIKICLNDEDKTDLTSLGIETNL